MSRVKLYQATLTSLVACLYHYGFAKSFISLSKHDFIKKIVLVFAHYKKGVNNMMIIDSPITPYSTKEEVEGWLKDLESMPNEKEVLEEIEKTKEIINNFSNRVRE